VEQEKGECNGEDEDKGPQQEVNGVVLAVTAERAGGSPRPANGRQSLPNLDPSPQPSHNESGSRSDRDSDGELNSSDSAGDDEKEPRPAKRKQPSSSHGGPARKKRRLPLHQSPPRQRRPLSEPHRQYPKLHSPLNQRSRLATSSSAEGRLPLPAPSMPQSIDAKIPLDDSSLGRSSKATPPTLTEITFRLHSADYCSFTAIIYAEQGVSFGQLSRLIASIGHAGKINDFTIKPMEQYSFLVTGFSRYTSSRLSSGGKAMSTTAETGRDYIDATRPRTHHGKTIYAQPLASEGSESSSSDDDGSISDSDPDLSSDDNGYSSEAEKQGGLSTGMNIPWDPVDEQRLLAWKKEGKSWDWIFGKFPGRTENAVRTRLSMVKHRVKC
jgi:hypothetical protein